MEVQFDEENYGQASRLDASHAASVSGKESRMAAWLVSRGLAKDAKSADIILTILALLVFGISIYFFVFGFSKPVVSGPQRPPASLDQR